MLNQRGLIFASLATLIFPALMYAADAPTGPAYQIVLRSRSGEVTPSRSKDTQTGGGTISVEQVEPNTILVTMTGSAAAGSDCRSTHAALDFNLEQELEIIPTRKGLRPPRVGMVGRVIGTLQVTDGGKCDKGCGGAEQGPASAFLSTGGTNLLSLNVKPAATSKAQELAVNYREGPIEAPAVTGMYRLNASFRIGVTQGKGTFNRQFAVADFDPAPQLDGFWAEALKPFRAVPRKDFGYQLIIRVVEEPAQ